MKFPKIFLLLIIFVVGFAAFKLRPQKNQPTTTTTPKIVPDKVTKINSGDGSFSLIQTTKTLANGDLNNIFAIIDRTKNSESSLYEKTNPSTETMSIPANTWSPDNKQIFITEKGSPTNYYVFKADGSLYKDGQKYLDIRSYWEKSKNKYEIKDVSGWASGDLLYVYTTQTDGTNGPTFWFSTSSKKFLQLRPGP